MSIVEIYTNEIFSNLNPYHANFEPGRAIQLGDYGIMRGRNFIRIGSITDKDFDIQFKQRKDPSADSKQFYSRNSVEILFSAQGSLKADGAVNANANLKIDFQNENSVFFNAAQCTEFSIENKRALGEEIMKRFNAGTGIWRRDWVIVTDMISAKSTTVVISGGKNASILIEADGTTPRINLTDASVKLSASTQKNIGYQVVGIEGLTPLIGFCKIQPTFFWWGDDFKPYPRDYRDFESMTAVIDTPEIKTEDNNNPLFFGQVR